MKRIFFVSLLMLLSIFVFGQSGMPGMIEKYQFQPEAWAIPTYSDGEVDESGHFNISAPISSIGTQSGLKFDFSISYSSNIKYADPSGWLGLGWNANVGAITRSVQVGKYPNVPNGTYTDFHPVDYPDLVETSQWDAARDIYTLVLPTGESLQFCIGSVGTNKLRISAETKMETVPVNSGLNIIEGYKWHEFLPLNLKNYKIRGYYSATSTSTVQVSIHELNRNNTVSDIPRKDYLFFEIITDDGTHYIYSAPTVDCYGSNYPNSKYSLFYYVNTWRIIAVIPGNIKFQITGQPDDLYSGYISYGSSNSENDFSYSGLFFNYSEPVSIESGEIPQKKVSGRTFIENIQSKFEKLEFINENIPNTVSDAMTWLASGDHDLNFKRLIRMNKYKKKSIVDSFVLDETDSLFYSDVQQGKYYLDKVK